MPATYDYTASQTQIRCSHCGNSVRVDGGLRNDGEDATTTGTRVADFIRWLPARGIYHSWCRPCERAARRASGSGTTAARRNGQARPAVRNLLRKFGVELELIFPAGMTRASVNDALRAAGLVGWNTKGDGSLSGGNGMEVVTPPLSGEAGMESLRTGMRILRELGAKPNRSCGTHVHHDVSDVNVASLKRFIKGWASNQRGILDGLVAPSRRGEASPYYCHPLSANDLTRIERITTLEGFRRNYPVDRYRTINLQAYARYGTVEIRQHQGTTDFEKMRSWILLGQAMLDAAKSEALPTTAQSSVMTFLTRLGTMLDETAKTFLIGRAVEFGYAAVTGTTAVA